jgi:hypothetical protein
MQDCWCIPEVACRNSDKETGSVPHPAAFSLRSQVFQLLTRIPCILRKAKVLKLSFHLSWAIQYAPFLSAFRLKLFMHFSFLPVSSLNSQFLDGLGQFLDLLNVSFDFLTLIWNTCLGTPWAHLVASITSVISLSQTLKYGKSPKDNKKTCFYGNQTVIWYRSDAVCCKLVWKANR